MMKIDAHVHTPFCPHGSRDRLSRYAERGIQLGFEELTFTEHAPLPETFSDPVPNKDSALPADQVEAYIKAVQEVKKEYSGEIKINLGFEVDYIEGFEKETAAFLNQYGSIIDDSILSVHFLLAGNAFHCLDFSPEGFKNLCLAAGSISAAHSLYYRTVGKSITADLGDFKPKRIGHITLVHKFQSLFPVPSAEKDLNDLDRLLDLVKEKGYELDYNTAGLRKEYCKTPYPYREAAELALKKKIPLVYGSDAHASADLGADYHNYVSLISGSPQMPESKEK
ncbi:histidinol-phosphatase HisJ [Metabacillus mangrovi]|nr:histidinol-phosphatase HisJ [Metabacillus mangrovi]